MHESAACGDDDEHDEESWSEFGFYEKAFFKERMTLCYSFQDDNFLFF